MHLQLMKVFRGSDCLQKTRSSELEVLRTGGLQNWRSSEPDVFRVYCFRT
ncbi:hypothetical protein A2U01_0106678, partial [Trifolium medium]|nr:hypothetical protein [Trifolium medium]